MLSAVIYVNRDGILMIINMNTMMLDWPFMYQLGQAIYNYELKRPRKFAPRLENSGLPMKKGI